MLVKHRRYVPQLDAWVEYRPVPRYKFWTFVLDIILASLTGGLWLLWPAFKFLRTGRR